jgi:beta-galactosidase
MDVHVIGEKNLLQDDPLIQRLDAILVPHQAALPQSVKSKLTTYWKNGGSLNQDMRLGEFDENGKPTFDWMHEVFGIADIEWKKNGGIFLIDGAIYRLKPSRRLYAGYAAITPKNGFKVLATELLRNDKGIMVRGERTLAFGFLPQLVEDHTGDAWRKLFVKEIMNTLPSRKTAAAERQ